MTKGNFVTLGLKKFFAYILGHQKEVFFAYITGRREYFSFTLTLLRSVPETCKIFMQHMSDKYLKRNFFFFPSTLFIIHILDISTKINNVSKQRYISRKR
jgi:hypothetical protein